MAPRQGFIDAVRLSVGVSVSDTPPPPQKKEMEYFCADWHRVLAYILPLSSLGHLDSDIWPALRQNHVSRVTLLD